MSNSFSFSSSGERIFLRSLHEPLEALLDLAQVADHQVEFDVLDVAQRVDARRRVESSRVFKARSTWISASTWRRWPM